MIDTTTLDLELDQQLRGAGYSFTTKDIKWDDALHYMNGEDPFGIKGWYVARTRSFDKNTVRFIIIGEWVKNEKITFKASTKKLSKSEQETLRTEETATRQKAQAKKEALWVEKARLAYSEWSSWTSCGDSSPYLERKGLYQLAKEVGYSPKESAFLGAKIVRESGSVVLKVPMRDLQGQIWGIQTIEDNGTKHFMDGQKISELCLMMGELHAKGEVYVAEGFSTAATVHLSTRKTVLVAFGAGNFEALAVALRRSYPLCKIVFLPDNDTGKLDRDFRPLETGLQKARAACSRSASSLILPSFANAPHKDGERPPSDYNDLYLLLGSSEVRSQIEAHKAIAPHEYIQTEHMGFYEERMSNGKLVKIPRFDHLADYFERNHRFVVRGQDQTVFVWNGTLYKETAKGNLTAYAEKLFERDFGEKTSVAFERNEFALKIQSRNIVDPHWFEESTEGRVAFRNGVREYKTGAFSPHSPEWGFRFVLPYDYDPEAKCPVFEKMLDVITGGNKEYQQALLEYMGYCLSNADCSKMQKALVLVGGGENGKSTFMDVVRDLLGAENCASIKLSALDQDYKAAKIYGKLANICEENNQKEQDIATNDSFKNMVSGGMVSARSPYKDVIDFRNRAKFIFSFNEFERITETTHGFTRRLIIVPFETLITKDSPHFVEGLKEKLKGELSGILNVALKAYEKAEVRGHLFEPEYSKKWVAEKRIKSDSVALFLEEYMLIKTAENEKFFDEHWVTPSEVPKWVMRRDGEVWVSTHSLLPEYMAWCEASGFRAVNAVSFGTRFGKLVPVTSSKVLKVDGRCVRAFRLNISGKEGK